MAKLKGQFCQSEGRIRCKTCCRENEMMKQNEQFIVDTQRNVILYVLYPLPTPIYIEC